MKDKSFDDILSLDIGEVKRAYKDFLKDLSTT